MQRHSTLGLKLRTSLHNCDPKPNLSSWSQERLGPSDMLKDKALSGVTFLPGKPMSLPFVTVTEPYSAAIRPRLISLGLKRESLNPLSSSLGSDYTVLSSWPLLATEAGVSTSDSPDHSSLG